MRQVPGSYRILLLMAWACLSCGRPEGAGKRAAEAGHAIVDEDYRFRIDPPGHGWRLLAEEDIRKLVPDAIAGGASEAGRYGVVIAEEAPGAEVEGFARQILDNMPLEEKAVSHFGAVEFKGRKAVRFDVSGRISGIAVAYRGTIFLRGGYGFQVLCWGTRASVGPDSFKPFLDSFHFLEGDVRGRKARVEVIDSHGVGWRVKDGKFYSAALRVAVEPGAGWRLAVGSELAQMNSDAEVGLVHSEPDAYVALIIERAAGVDKAAFEETVLNQWAEGTEVEPLGKPLTTRIMGRSVRLHRFRLVQQPPIEYMRGVFFDRDLCYQVTAWHTAGLREKVDPILPTAFASLRILTAEEAARIRDDLQKETDPENRVGPGFCLRRGIYRHFDQGFVLRKPTKGFWRIYVGADARAQNEDATIFLEEPALGLLGLVINESADEFTGVTYHTTVSENMFGEENAAVEAGPAIVTLDGVPALSTQSVLACDDLMMEFRVVTTVHRGRAHQFIVYGIPGNMKASAAEVDRVLEGVRFPENLPRTAEKHGVYMDHRLGYALRLPEGTWKRSDSTPAAVRPVGTVQMWRAGKRLVGVLSLCMLEEGQDAEWFREFMNRTLVRSFDIAGSIEPEHGKSTLAGLPCDRIRWKGVKLALDIYVLVRDRTFYALIVGTDGLFAATNAEEVKRGFRLIE